MKAFAIGMPIQIFRDGKWVACEDVSFVPWDGDEYRIKPALMEKYVIVDRESIVGWCDKPSDALELAKHGRRLVLMREVLE